MKNMTPIHEAALAQEIARAREQMDDRRYDEAMVHLERAHVLGQRFIAPHVIVHWLMFRVAMGRLQPAAAIGQLVRIALGAVGSAVGKVPIGNTGGSDVNMFKPMPIAPELARIMEREGARNV